jgi:hypothetical protein
MCIKEELTPVDYDKLEERYEEFLRLGTLPEKEREEKLRQFLRRIKEEEQQAVRTPGETTGEEGPAPPPRIASGLKVRRTGLPEGVNWIIEAPPGTLPELTPEKEAIIDRFWAEDLPGLGKRK